MYNQSGRAYHCFCTPERLAETRKRLQREGSHEGYDRRCLGLPQEEVQERLQRGERNIVRFKVRREFSCGCGRLSVRGG